MVMEEGVTQRGTRTHSIDIFTAKMGGVPVVGGKGHTHKCCAKHHTLDVVSSDRLVYILGRPQDQTN